MTAPTTTEPGTAMTQTTPDGPTILPKRREYASVLDPRAQAMLDERKAMMNTAAKVAEQNWGKGLDIATRQAVAVYLRGHAMDVTEIDVLGGNIYRNARYYLRRLSEMVEAGKVEYARADHINVDPRLEEIIARGGPGAKDAAIELDRRAMQRIIHNAPDAAKAICVFRIKLVDNAEEFVGCKWAGGGTRQSDPVGDKFPVESTESRAARRCLRLVASQMPALKRIEDILDEGSEVVSTKIVEAHARANALIDDAPAPQLAATSADDVYGLNEPPKVPEGADTPLVERNARLARYDDLLGKLRLSDDEAMELTALRTELFPELAATLAPPGTPASPSVEQSREAERVAFLKKKREKKGEMTDDELEDIRVWDAMNPPAAE